MSQAPATLTGATGVKRMTPKLMVTEKTFLLDADTNWENCKTMILEGLELNGLVEAIEDGFIEKVKAMTDPEEKALCLQMDLNCRLSLRKAVVKTEQGHFVSCKTAEELWIHSGKPSLTFTVDPSLFAGLTL